MEPGMYDETNSLIMSWEKLAFKGINKVFEGATTMKNTFDPGIEYKIILPDSICLIPQNAFDSCNTLISITMPGVQVIEKSAFIGCANLKEVNFSNNLKNIKYFAFADCTSLTNIILPDSLKNLGESAFYGAIKLKNIKLPHIITEIPMQCFAQCYDLQNINLENIKKLRSGCFYKCKSLKSANLSKLETIESSVFAYCNELEEVILNNNLSEIGYCMFNKCYNLKNINLPEKLKSIELGAFLGTNIEEIVIPKHIEYISTAFTDMPSLKTITIKGTPNKISDNNFTECPNLKEIYISKNVYNKLKPNFSLLPHCKIKFEHTLDDLLEKKSFKEANKCIMEERNNLISR